MKYKLVPHSSGLCCPCALYNDQDNILCGKHDETKRYPNCVKEFGTERYMYVIVRCTIPQNIKVI